MNITISRIKKTAIPDTVYILKNLSLLPGVFWGSGVRQMPEYRFCIRLNAARKTG